MTRDRYRDSARETASAWAASLNLLFLHFTGKAERRKPWLCGNQKIPKNAAEQVRQANGEYAPMTASISKI